MYCLPLRSGGAVSYIRNLAPLLSTLFRNAPEGHTIKFLAHEDQRELLGGVEDSKVVWVQGQRPMAYSRIWWESQNISRIVRREKIDVLFTPYQVGPRVHSLKHVLMLRNMEPFLCGEYRYSVGSRMRNALLRRSSARALRRADRVIAVSEFARDHLTGAMGIDSARVCTIYHGRNRKLISDCDPEEDRDTLVRLGVGPQFLLTCGSLLPYRRCEDVIAAFNHCADGLPAGMQLVIAGAGTDRRYGELIRQAIADSPNRAQILAVGHVSSSTMAALYRHCRVCVIATEIEACPNIAIEAMTAGCAIVSSDRPPLPEMFRGASLEYHARDIGHLVRQIRRCMEDEDLRRALRMRALQRAEAFSWKKCASLTFSALVDWPG